MKAVNPFRRCRRPGALAVAALGLALSACGANRSDSGLFCSSACSNPNEARDFLCGCYPKVSQIPTHDDNDKPDTVNLVADCLCDDRTGTYSAWFFNDTTEKTWLLNKRVRVAQTQCAWLNVCPMRHEADGSERYFTVSTPKPLKVTLVGSSGQWGANYVRGTLVDNHAALAGPRALPATMTGSDVFAATLALAVEQQLATQAVLTVPAAAELAPARRRPVVEAVARLPAPAVDNGIQLAQTTAPLPCETLCDPQKPTPYCTSVVLGGSTPAAFRQLFELSHDQGVALYPKDLVQGLFEVDSDPCTRSDTTITDGVIRNTGGACSLTTRSTFGGLTITASLDVPATLSGNIVRTATAETIDFPDAATAMTLSFENESFQSDFGGRVTRLIASPDRLIWQTAKRCLALGLQ